MIGSKLFILVGPPGVGKSTFAHNRIYNDGDHGAATVRISQDDQGKAGHQDLFMQSVAMGHDIIVDRMNFSVQQRANYLLTAKKAGYDTEIIVLHESYKTCLDRALARKGHPTITDEKGARSAIQTFFTKYERPQPGEADKITFIYPDGKKPLAVICDLDGTLCDVEHRRHHVRKPEGEKKDWAAWNREIPNDTINMWCHTILASIQNSNYIKSNTEEMISIVFCSGRGDNERKVTQEWLNKHGLGEHPLYMRNRHDSRQDAIIKEIILDFELLTRYTPYFMIDDRKQVVDMWRKRGFTCLQCAEGDF